MLHISGLARYVEDMESDHKNVIEINQNEEWKHEMYLFQDVVVKSGCELKISSNNKTIFFARNGKLIVEKGAKLRITNGNTLSCWSRKGMWKGIELEGTPTAGQYIGTNGLCQNQAILEIGEIGGFPNRIERAKYAVYCSLTDTNGYFIHNTGGAIVKIINAKLVNNKWGVVFYPHLFNTESVIKNTEFNFLSALGIDENSNLLITPSEHIKLYGNVGLKISGCMFRSNASAYVGANKGTGILSVDSKFTIDRFCNNANCSSYTRNSFSKLYYGIILDDINPLNNTIIQNCDFQNIGYVGVLSLNTNCLLMSKCNFTSGNWGVYLKDSKNYNLRSNLFTDGTWTGIGIIAYNSGSGVHTLFDNSFKELSMGINAIDENAPNSPPNYPYDPDLGLRMNCNNFAVSNTNNSYDIGVTSYLSNTPMVMENQSSSSTNLNAKQLVRNQYNAISFGNENKFYVDPGSNQSILHKTSIDNICRPNIPTSQCSQQVIVQPQSGMFFDYNNHCALATNSFRNADNAANDDVVILKDRLNELFDDSNSDKAEKNIALVSLFSALLADTTITGGVDSALSVANKN